MSSLNKDVFLILLMALALRMLFVFVIPMVEAPDEYAHFWVTAFISVNGFLPRIEDIAAAGPSAVYGPLPAFGYLPHVLYTWLAPGVPISLSERMGSVLMGLVTVYASARLGRYLFPDSRFFAMALPALLAFHPQLIFVNSYCNNDSTACAFATLMLLALVRCILLKPDAGSAVTLGILAGCTILSKYSGIAVVAAAVISLPLSCAFHKMSLKSTIGVLLSYVVTTAMSLMPYLTRNFIALDGDFLGTRTMRQIWAVTFQRPLDFFMAPWQVIRQPMWLYQSFTSFWAVFGYQKHYLSGWVYFLYGVSILLSMAGALASAVSRRTAKVGEEAETSRLRGLAWATLALCVIINMVSMVAASCFNIGGPQGRYLFPSEAAIFALLLFGFSRLPGKSADYVALSFVLLNLAVSIASFAFLHQISGFISKPY